MSLSLSSWGSFLICTFPLSIYNLVLPALGSMAKDTEIKVIVILADSSDGQSLCAVQHFETLATNERIEKWVYLRQPLYKDQLVYLSNVFQTELDIDCHLNFIEGVCVQLSKVGHKSLARYASELLDQNDRGVIQAVAAIDYNVGREIQAFQLCTEGDSGVRIGVLVALIILKDKKRTGS